MSNTNNNIEIIRHFLENAFIEGHMERCNELVSANVVVHGPSSNQKTFGLDNIKEIDLGFSKAFKRNHLAIKEIFSSEEKVVVLWEMEAIHTGELKVFTEKPIPATNLKVLIEAMTIYRLEKGKICEVWQGWDLQGLLLKLKNLRDHQKLDFSELDKKEDYLQGIYLLSSREKECINHLLNGDTAKETAKKLHLSFRTVESHIERAKNKLNCIDKRELFKASLFLKRMRLI
ncbi:MAG: ester cyclase [Chlamydiota bacterium]|nr:ester cyclase [Chlamydiota bacterium]